MITLEISSTDIRLMEVEGDRVIRWASRSLEPEMFEEEVVTEPQAFSAAVKQLMASSGIRGRNVTASVSGLYSISRIVMVPNPPGGPTTQMVMDAATAIMPLSDEEIYFSWQSLATVEGGQQVLAMSVPRDVLDSEMLALRAAGINPRTLDLKTMALVRAVNRAEAIILNIDSGSFDTIIVVGGVAEIMRTTAWQPADLTAEDRAEHLAVALELTAGFYDSHHPSLPLDPSTPLFITGHLSGDLALMDELRGKVAYPIEPFTPPLQYPPHLPVSQYAVNIGLALKRTASARSLGESSYSLPDVNLLPPAYRPWRPSARQIYLFLAVVAAIALLFPLYQVTLDAMGDTSVLETKYEIINSELERRQAEIKTREPLQKTIGDYTTIVTMGGGFTEDLAVINSLAEEVGIVVASISHDGSSINVSCQGDSYLTFREYKTALEESGRFSSPVTPPEGYPYITGGSIKLEPKPAE